MWHNIEEYLELIRQRKNWISYNTKTDFVHMNYGRDAWKLIKKDAFYFMIEKKLIYCTSDLNDEDYIYRPTHIGLNYHLISKK